MPSFSKSYKRSVRIASISGTIISGLCFFTTFSSAPPSSMSITSNPSATCMAGAFAYLSHAVTYCPARLAAITNSLPSSPEPNNNIFFISSAILVHVFVIILIVARGHVVEPLLVLEIPLHGLLDALFKLQAWLPTQFALQLGRIDGIARVVSKAVGHIG